MSDIKKKEEPAFEPFCISASLYQDSGEEVMLLFGYGSLMWKTGFEVESTRYGHLKGWKRRFWQTSPDHRGTIDSPGRVATILKCGTFKENDHFDKGEESLVTGVLYSIKEESVKSTMEYLNIREIAGYSIVSVDVLVPEENNPSSYNTITAMMFTGTIENEHFIANEDMDDCAAVISKSIGPSGANYEYLFKLVHTLKEKGFEDAYLFELERRVRSIRTAAGY